MRKAILILWFLVLAVLAYREGSQGVAYYRDGRFREAHEAFVSECEEAGEDAKPESFYNRALAALRIENLSDAEVSAEKAAAGESALRPRTDFLLGNAAFARCVMAERQAATAAAEPFAFEIAIRYGEKARDLWMQAAMSRPDWPEARRNVERAQTLLESLRGKKNDAERKKAPRPEPTPRPLPDPGNVGPEPEPPPDGKISELSPGEVRALFERLATKEREKRTVREAHRRERMTGVERDW